MSTEDPPDGHGSDRPIDDRIFDLAREVVGLFARDGTLRTASPHWSFLGTVDRLHDLTEPAYHALIDDHLAHARDQGDTRIVVPFRGGAVLYQWRLHAFDDDALCVALTPVDPGPALAHAAVAGAAAGIALTDPEGRLHYVNDAFLHIYGYSREELIGRMFTDVLRPGDREAALERHYAHINQLIEPRRIEAIIVRGSGGHRTVDVRTGRVVLPQGVFRMSTVFDVTEIRENEWQLADTEARYRHIFDNTSEGIFRSTPEGRLVEVNWPLVRMHGCRSKEELIEGIRHLETDWYINAEDRSRFSELLERDGHVENFEVEARRFGTGERFWTSESASAIRDVGDQVVYYQGTVRDITEDRRRRELAANRADVLERIARGGDLVDTLYEIVGAIEHYHPRLTAAICRLQDDVLHVQAAPGLANCCIDAIDGRPPSRVGGPIAATVRTGKPVLDADMADRGSDTSALARGLLDAGYSNVMALPVRDQSGATLGVLAVFVAHRGDTAGDLCDALHEMAQIASLAFEQQSLADQLLRQAQYDPLTGLPNRVLFDDRLNHLVHDAGRRKYPVAVMMLDLDEFKLVNDTLGHRTGDELLRQVALRLEDCLRSGDTVARFGGDEFVIVAPLDSLSRATDIAERILRDLEPAFRIDGDELHARPSIGISLFPQDGQTADGLIQAADTAMYAAKRAGKNHFRYFSEAMNAEVTHRLRVEADLRRAVAGGELVLYYQPIVACGNEDIVGVEALLRWRHPEHGLIMPGSFLPIAELSDLIGMIDHYVLSTAARQIARWRTHCDGPAAPAVYSSVNLSAHGLHEPGFARDVVRILEEADVPPSAIELEITESMVMRDFEGAVNQLRDLKERAHGIRVAIDDFGTGHSSFEYLRKLPVDTLKIDRSFVADLDQEGVDRTARAIVKTIAELGRNLGLRVVAEGVESRRQADFLDSVGCHRAQGFLFSAPVDVAGIERYVRRRSR